MLRKFNTFFKVDQMTYTFSGKGRSKFMLAITEALREQKQTLMIGRQLVIQLATKKEGYLGTYDCEINSSTSSITVNFKNPDPTRFPTRIKAAARVLCREGFDGTFEISHRAGTLTIKKI